ncbi:MAG: hypothetical protein ACOYXW_05850 [Actinomycetota bacterium]
MDVVAGLIPSIGVALLFWYAIRLMVQADRREREALARMQREESAGASRPPAADSDAASS